jgi:hypothetical protein
VRAEFFRAEAPDRVVGVAVWDGRRAQIETEDPHVRQALERVFKPSSVAVDEPPMRSPGTSHSAVLEPGDEEWFRSAARHRGEREGLSLRLVVDRPRGWDPALDPQTYGWAGRKAPSRRP